MANKNILDGNIINEDEPLPVAVVETQPGRHIIDGNVIDEQHPLAVKVTGEGGTHTVLSLPPEGFTAVKNLYLAEDDGELVLIT